MPVAVWTILADALDADPGSYVNTLAWLETLSVSQVPSSYYMALSFWEKS